MEQNTISLRDGDLNFPIMINKIVSLYTSICGLSNCTHNGKKYQSSLKVNYQIIVQNMRRERKEENKDNMLQIRWFRIV